MGRKPAFEDALEVQEKITEYFAAEEKPTWPGIALHLGVTTRTLENYIHKDSDVGEAIRLGHCRLQDWLAKQLYTDRPCTGYIFALKNMGWSDRREVEHSGGVTLVIDKDDDSL